jgi:DNA-binding SARP family transcriptional activator/class 3 adenylate cyclase/tetratricopeptide (TPR) repeat protein
MEFRILGPLEVLDNGRVVDVGAAKQRALLAVLLLNANRVVSTDSLIEALWGERPPATAQKALQVYVSQLRKAVGRDRILTRSPGYELGVGPGELDLERVETLAAEGKLEQALTVWRGSPLAEFAYEPFAQAEIARLEELRVTCLEQRIERDLADGRHAALVGELEALVREHPLRERLRAQLMLALYRSGRQAEALDAYQAGRALLSDELGLEPGADLKELQRAILEHDALLAPPQPPEPITRPNDVPAQTTSPLTRTREVRKTVTVLFCDVTAVGAELDLESLRRLTARGFDELLPVLERHGATVERSLGGAAAAIFGIPVVHEDDALRAARAATEIRERLAALRAELEAHWGAWLALRIGIGTGEVVAGGEPSAIGEPVQSALGLQQEARPDELLVDERTHQLVREAVEFETSDGRIRIVGMCAIPPGPVRRFDSPMVGRDRERRRLDDAFEQAVGDRSCQLFTILGAAGVGKSRLVQEFVSHIPADALVARGRCLPYGEGITYWPVLEAVRDAARLDDAASSEDNLKQLAALLDGEEGAVAARRLGEVLGLVEQTSSAEETFRAVRTFVEALARRRPLVLVFDDIHWGEATFLDLVDHVSDWVRAAPVLLVCMARPELLEVRPQWGGGKLNATSVLLEPLSDADSVKLLDNLAGSTDLDEPARQRIVETSGGNPLFVEEMLALLLEDDRDRAVEVPATIQALLAARLDRLPDNERAAIEAASVEGKVFHEASVAELAAVGVADVREALLALVRRDLIRNDSPVFSGERAYRFRHLLIRDAAYESIPKEARATLHERHARLLDARFGDRAIELEEIVGYHYEQAFQYRAELGSIDDHARALGRAAAERLGEAGRRAFLRSDGPAGVNLISRSVALLPPDDPFRVELVPNVRVIQGLTDLSWADRVLTEGVEAAATSGDRRLAAHALVQRGFLRLFTTSEVTPEELIDVSDRAIAVFTELGDELGLARAWRLVGQAHYLDRRAAASAEAAERALTHIRRAPDRFEEREIVEWLAIAHILGPTPVGEALATCRRLLDETPNDREIRAEVIAVMASLFAMLGRTAEAHDQMHEAQAIMDATGERIWIVAFWWSFVHSSQGDAEAGERELRPTYESLKTIGEKSHFSSMAHALASVTFAQGRYEEAEALTRECEEASRANDVHSQIHWRSIRARVLSRRGAFAEAEVLAREAIAIAEGSDFLPAHADALMGLADVLDHAGRSTESIPAVERAIALYEEKENLMAVTGARAELERLRRAV